MFIVTEYAALTERLLMGRKESNQIKISEADLSLGKNQLRLYNKSLLYNSQWEPQL